MAVWMGQPQREKNKRDWRGRKSNKGPSGRKTNQCRGHDFAFWIVDSIGKETKEIIKRASPSEITRVMVIDGLSTTKKTKSEMKD
jgi:hypothetical protein